MNPRPCYTGIVGKNREDSKQSLVLRDLHFNEIIFIIITWDWVSLNVVGGTDSRPCRGGGYVMGPQGQSS